MPKLFRECVQCGNSFYINEADQAFFTQKGLEFPKRCFNCRKQNKSDRDVAMSSPISYEDEVNCWKSEEDVDCTAKRHCPGCSKYTIKNSINNC
jgi:hypothetical protein